MDRKEAIRKSLLMNLPSNLELNFDMDKETFRANKRRVIKNSVMKARGKK